MLRSRAAPRCGAASVGATAAPEEHPPARDLGGGDPPRLFGALVLLVTDEGTEGPGQITSATRENVRGMDTPTRLLRLLGLLSSRAGWTGAELAERLEVTERTLRRDV